MSPVSGQMQKRLAPQAVVVVLIRARRRAAMHEESRELTSINPGCNLTPGLSWSRQLTRRPVVRSFCRRPRPHFSSRLMVKNNGVALAGPRSHQSALEISTLRLKCAMENARERVQGRGRLRFFFWPRRATC